MSVSFSTHRITVLSVLYADFTRISEYKHSPNQPAAARASPGTVIFKVSRNKYAYMYLVAYICCGQEYSTDEGDPYYPVPNPRNQELYAKYQALAQQEQGVTFVGRLASYKYFNMDQAILNALELFDKLVEERKLLPKKSS